MGLSIYHWLSTYGPALGLAGDVASSTAGVERATNNAWPGGLPGREQEPGLDPGRLLNASQLGQETFEQVTLIRGIAARISQEMALSNASIFDVAILAEVLELPFNRAWPAMRPMALLASQLLRQLSRRRPLKRSEGTWISIQIAYLRALDSLLQQERILHRPWLTAAQIPLDHALALSTEEALENVSLRALLETLRPQRLTDTQAEQALTAGAQSLLVQQIRQVMVAWFSFNGTEEREAQLLIQRLEHGLAGHLLAAIAENATPLAQLQKFVRLGYLTTWSDTTERDYELLEDANPSSLTIEPQRELYRAQLLQGLSEPLLGQVFSLKDLYIPPVGEILNRGRDPGVSSTAPLTDVLDWAVEQLNQTERIPVVEADPGQGKTSFCQMFAVRIAQELYPTWMPIVISLRGLTLGATLEETIAPALPSGLFTAQESWLSAQNPPAVLLLDGLDELPLGPDGEGQVSQFLWQLKAFQRRYQTEAEHPRHRIFLTSQPETMEMLVQAHPELNLEAGYQRLRLMPMDQDALRQWFRQWASLQTKAIAQSYFNFLKNGGAFRNNKSVQDLRLSLANPQASPMTVLAHQPFTLLLMAVLHRDGFLDDRVFGLSTQALDFEIFERLNFWLMGAATDAYPQPGMIADLSRTGPAHACRTPDAVANLLAGRSPRSLRRQIQALSLKLHQSGRGQIALTQLSQSPQLGEPSPLDEWDSIQPLPDLYFRQRSLADASTAIIFSNPALGDYNCAEAIASYLQTVTRRCHTVYGEAFVLSTDSDVARHLYGLLSHGLLPPRLIRFITERLLREARRQPAGVSLAKLRDRLYNFYRYYCRGRWLDEGLPQEAHRALAALDNPYSLLQIDAAVGVNVFSLLCVISREAQRPFWPCGNAMSRVEYNPNRLLQFIGRTAVLSPLTFWLYNRQHLSGLHLNAARLSNLMLAEAELAGVQCSNAALVGVNFENANLRGANLSESNLTRANLQGADLQGANLSGADLRWANLQGANLQGCNVVNACFAHAQLDSDGTVLAQEGAGFFSVTEYQILQQLAQQDEPLNLASATDPKFFGADETVAAANSPASPFRSGASSEGLEEPTEELSIDLEDKASPPESSGPATSAAPVESDSLYRSALEPSAAERSVSGQSAPADALAGEQPQRDLSAEPDSGFVYVQETLRQPQETDTLSQSAAKNLHSGENRAPVDQADASNPETLHVSLEKQYAIDETLAL